MRITIAMATYNGERFLGRQLASFVEQQRLPDELVVTDDGSSDGTVALVKRFALTAPFPIRIERNPERLGYSRNFERAIALASGDIILISDQDDSWDSDKIATIVNVFGAAQGPVVTVNDQRIVDAHGRPTGGTIFGNSRRAGLAKSNLIAGSCTAFSSALLPLLMPFPDRLPYDSWIGMVADSLGIKRLIERPLQLYRRHADTATVPIATTTRPSRLTAFRIHGMASPIDGWQRELGWRGVLIDRLRDPARTDPLGLPQGALQRAETHNRDRIADLVRRAEIIARPRSTRWPAVFIALADGLYGRFDGFRSFAKDLVRR